MVLEVNIYSSLRNYLNPKPPLGVPIVFDDAEGRTISELIEELEIPLDDVAIIMVNHVHQNKSYTITKDDRRVGIFPLSGGG